MSGIFSCDKRMLARARLSQSRLASLHGLGYAYLRATDYDAAIACFQEALRIIDDFDGSRSRRDAVLQDLALSFTCKGDQTRAAEVINVGGGCYEPARIMTVMRLGDFEQAARVPFRSSRWLPKVRRHNKRVFRLLQCFAFAELGRELPSKDLDKVRPKTAFEYRYLTANWPELRTFIAECDLEPHGRRSLPAARAVAVPERLLSTRD